MTALDIYYVMILVWIMMTFVAVWVEMQAREIDTVWFIGASIVSVFMALAGMAWQWQIAIFLVTSISGFLFLFFFTRKSKIIKGYAAATERYVGQTTRILPGQIVYIDGRKFKYSCSEPVKAGDKVSIISVHDKVLKVRKQKR